MWSSPNTDSGRYTSSSRTSSDRRAGSTTVVPEDDEEQPGHQPAGGGDRRAGGLVPHRPDDALDRVGRLGGPVGRVDPGAGGRSGRRRSRSARWRRLGRAGRPAMGGQPRARRGEIGSARPTARLGSPRQPSSGRRLATIVQSSARWTQQRSRAPRRLAWRRVTIDEPSARRRGRVAACRTVVSDGRLRCPGCSCRSGRQAAR